MISVSKTEGQGWIPCAPAIKYACSICNSVFTNSQGLNAHKKKHRGTTVEHLLAPVCSILTRKITIVGALSRHDAAYKRNTKTCPVCYVVFSNKENTFCSSSCAATHNNKGVVHNKNGHRGNYTRRAINKISVPLSYKQIRAAIAGPYTRIVRNMCAKTGRIFYYPTYRKYHPDTSAVRAEYARSCKFKFSVLAYPHVFDLNMLFTYGWYSTPGSRKGVRNINGVSRDHIVSIADGWTYKIPSKLMRHPANCMLVQHRDNQKKQRKSLLTPAELIEAVDDFDLIWRSTIDTYTERAVV